MDRARLNHCWRWRFARVVGRPPHLLATTRARRIGGGVWGCVATLSIVGACYAWPHWSTAPLGLFAIIQLLQLVVLAAEHSWAKHYGFPQWKGDTSVFTREAAIEREQRIDSGRASQLCTLRRLH